MPMQDGSKTRNERLGTGRHAIRSIEVLRCFCGVKRPISRASVLRLTPLPHLDTSVVPPFYLRSTSVSEWEVLRRYFRGGSGTGR